MFIIGNEVKHFSNTRIILRNSLKRFFNKMYLILSVPIFGES